MRRQSATRNYKISAYVTKEFFDRISAESERTEDSISRVLVKKLQRLEALEALERVGKLRLPA